MKTEKPPYRVPSMAEIAAVPDNGLRIVSTFSGCGGSCLGYRMAGYRVVWANEFIPAAADTYRANHPTTPLDTRDIRKVQPEEILEATGLKVGEIDAVEGSPPCASFSTAGKREKHWGKAKPYSDTVQRVDDLFFEYIRLVNGLRPRVFVAENVSGLVKGVAKGYFLEILAKLKACGYRVGCKVLDAQWLGVPQARQRTIFIGVRQDQGLEPVFPKPLPYRYSLREALPWIVRGKYGPAWKAADAPSPTVSAGRSYNPATSHQGLELVEAKVIQGPQGNGWAEGKDLTDGPAPAVLATQTQSMLVQARLKGGTGAAFDEKGREYDLDQPCPTILGTKPNQFEVDMSRFAISREWDKLKPGQASDKYFNLVRPHPDQPCPTICAAHGHPGIASVTHPTEKRKLTIAELKRICAFPDDFILTGTYSQQWERLGRAVPPVMSFQIARTIRDEILT
ncbi:MAG TPA: DNA cytosine methyltransferase [Verrucomicrobiota bacterium]|nr:DNA cytosine methyltransferase [Verrucomicrobiota bacterium]HNU53123.1 DNA cytosine methyltransferase [Verrucomicrobiota bacterium]